MAPQITVPPEQLRPGGSGGRKGRSHRRCLRRAPRYRRCPAGRRRGRAPADPGQAEGAERPAAPQPLGRGFGSRSGLICPPLSRANSSRRAGGLRHSPGSQNVPDAWQARDAPGLGWLPYVFNKIRQIGPGDRDCSKPVIKQHKLGQCKRQKGPSWKGRWVPVPSRAARPGVSRSPPRCPRSFLSRFW